LFKKILYRLGLDFRPLSRRLWAIEIELRSEAAQARVQNLQQRVEQLELLLLGDPLPPPEPQALRQAGFSSPVVSVLLPLHNRAQGVVQAIASVQAQRFTDWELIVVDDGSTDGSAQAVARFTADPRIRYFHQEHQGAAVALNRALNEVRGALIAHLDSDNLWYPDFLAVAVAAFAADPALQCAYGALVSDLHFSTGERILFQTFDRKRLLEKNFIDRNTFIHRQSTVSKYGGFDETLTRLIDWDFVLRHTQDAPARRLPVLAARYRAIDDQRISTVRPVGPNYYRVRQKWRPAGTLPRPLRVLYVAWQYPQLSESYIETEIHCMKRWGVHVEVWSESCGASPFKPAVPVHYGSLDQAVAEAKPDLLHVHWLSFAESHLEVLRKAGLPLTVTAHGFDTNDARLQAVLSLATLRRVFCFPHQIPSTGAEPRFQPLRAAFDTTLFHSQPNKDRRFVVRTAAALPSKDLQRFFQIAKRLPEHRFVLALVTCSLMEPYVDEIRSLWRQQGCPGELMVDVPRERLAPLVEQAGLYLHTALLPSEPGGAPIGMPISIAEAMATGAHILVREGTPLIGYVGDAGSGYRDTDHAVQLIAETAQWPDSRWKQAWTRSVDRAYSFHADELALLPIYEQWCAILGKQLEVEPPAGGPMH
jgi:glycosyltransferase involved in cell wall biosynthesis